MWRNYIQPSSVTEALELLRQYGPEARVVAGGTDLVVEYGRGIRSAPTLIDIHNLTALRYINQEGSTLRLGALATHNDVLRSAECREGALPLVQACLEVGAPQIRTRATVAGNVITGSPANDTITPLMALGAEVVLSSVSGERVVPLGEFYTGVRRTVMRPDELLTEIRFPAVSSEGRGLFLKLGLRRAQAISVIHIGMVLLFSGDTVEKASIALGCLAPVIIHAPQAENFLKGKSLTPAVCAETGRLAVGDARPIDDLRGSAEYRLSTLAALVEEGLTRIANGSEAANVPARPVLLDTGGEPPVQVPRFRGTITTTINGARYNLENAGSKTLLNALREDAGLTGAKEGCAEGECGACTVWINGQAAMSCLVPAPQAHGARLTTIEGLAGTAAPEGDTERLHPLQEAFISRGAVQCGFCIPGMIMAGAKLLDEKQHPGIEEAQVAISGNICRCTGYRKILDAIMAAQHRQEPAVGGV